MALPTKTGRAASGEPRAASGGSGLVQGRHRRSEFRISNFEFRMKNDDPFSILHSKFEIRNSKSNRPSEWQPRAPRAARRSPQSGFTLAAVMIIMSVMLIFVAYTVPQQWSLVMRRQRELQTIFVMQQYAKACQAFADKNSTYPVSMQQLAEAVQPRFLRCPKDGCVDPLTGEVDWYVIPQSQAPPPGGGQAPPVPPVTPTTTQSANPQQTSTA